jgi:eukaryotic-like serine/threonine-protein kinase
MQTTAPVAPPYRPGDLVTGRYEIRSLLAQGGSSEVYLATDRVLRRSVVIKAPRVGLLRDPQAVARFRREAEGLARLSHPSLVTIHDVGLDPHGPYLVEEYVEGRSLADVLRDQGPFAIVRTEQIGAAVADAIAAVHDAGMLHRDLKPENLMLTPSGGVKLLDLGIVWGAEWTSLSSAGEILGTAAYVSPEQALGLRLDPRSDVYSLGVVLYEMLSGHPPFSGSTFEILDHHVRRPPRPVRSVRVDVPPRLAAVVERCLAKEPVRRPASARIVAEELRTCLRHPNTTDTRRLPAVTERPSPPRPTKRRARRFATAAAIVVVLAAALAMLTLPHAEAALRPPTKIAAHGGCDGFLRYRVVVVWQAPPGGADGYVVFRQSVPNGRWARAAVFTDRLVTTYEDHGLGASTEYRYEVRATQGDRLSQPSRPVTAGTPLICFG